jgi:hypothetical protein
MRRRRALSWTSAQLTAQHRDPIMGEGLHKHTWTFTVFWPSKPFRDLRTMREGLAAILAPFQGSELPQHLWASEDLAAMILGTMGVIVGVEVERPDIGGVELWS